MRILGIDPGYHICGWAIIEKEFRIIDFGILQTPSSLPLDERLLALHGGLENIIALYKPECAAVEKLFFNKNAKTVISVAQTIGAITLTLKLAGLPISEYTPLQVKKSISGYGHASKNQIQEMIMRLYGIKELSGPDDAADAVAIATCHSLYLVGTNRLPRG